VSYPHKAEHLLERLNQLSEENDENALGLVLATYKAGIFRRGKYTRHSKVFSRFVSAVRMDGYKAPKGANKKGRKPEGEQDEEGVEDDGMVPAGTGGDAGAGGLSNRHRR
jgi:hypothetical protein